MYFLPSFAIEFLIPVSVQLYSLYSTPGLSTAAGCEDGQ